jgi:hypothetical protein
MADKSDIGVNRLKILGHVNVDSFLLGLVWLRGLLFLLTHYFPPERDRTVFLMAVLFRTLIASGKIH